MEPEDPAVESPRSKRAAGIKAVLLAAGLGSRLVDAALPKSVMPIGPFSRRDPNPVSFLTRQIRLLRLAGVDEIAVVLGHRREQVAAALQPLPVAQIVNEAPDIRRSGSLHSFQIACHSTFTPLDGESHTLLLDADIVYEFSVLERLVQSLNGKSSLLITPNVNHDVEEVRVYGRQGIPRLIGKGLGGQLTRDTACLGEATGMVNLAPGDHPLVLSLMEGLMAAPPTGPGTDRTPGDAGGAGRIDVEHEVLSQRLMSLEKLEGVMLDPDMLFMEVDFWPEYERCVQEVYPRILDADQRRYPGLF